MTPNNPDKPDPPNQVERIVVDESEDQERLDSYLRRHFPRFSRVKLQRSIASGRALVDDRPAKSSTRLKTGQRVTFEVPVASPTGSLPENLPIDILYEDEAIVAINKSAAMVVHPAKGHWSGTLTAALAFHFENLSGVGGPTRPGIVHRLDRDTSGVILVAKTDAAHHHLARQFEQRTVGKEYLAIVSPAPDRDNDLIDKPIGAHPYQREKKAIRENHTTSRQAASIYQVQQRFRGFGLVCVKPKTGRTHQIRVHMAHIGCPVLCDRLYSGRSKLLLKDLTRQQSEEQVLLDRQALHARRIQFQHPESGESMTIEAPVPKDIQATLDALNQLRG